MTDHQAEIGYNESSGEVFLDHGSVRSYMQPSEARELAGLLEDAAEVAERGGTA